MARFYSNENSPRPVVEALRALGHDVLTSQDAGNANRRVDDPAVLAFATSLGRALLTLNRRDFRRLHDGGVAHQGIVACTQDVDFERQARRVDEEVRKRATLAGEFVRITKLA
jgi:hypothetical protein